MRTDEGLTMWGRQTTLSANSKNGREVVKTRKGCDRIPADTSGPSFKRTIPTKWVQAKDGTKWEIPYDPKTGLVPQEYIYARFLDADSGTRRGKSRRPSVDMGVTAERCHSFPNGATPEQLIQSGWWQHPNESDIEGIDDSEAESLVKELTGAAKSAQGVGKQIVFMMPESEAARARKVLAEDFNASDLKRAVKHGGLVIKEGNPGKGASGCYYAVHEDVSIKTPIIILRPGWDEETLSHEFTHHLRQTDETRGGLTRSPFKFNKKGERKSYWSSETAEFNSARNLEEAATVAESYVRTQKVEGVNGYYWYTSAHGKSPEDRSEHDRKLLAPDEKTARGRKAEKIVTQKFDEASISHLSTYHPGSNAGKYYAKRKAEGTMPKPQKPVKTPKTAGDVPKSTGTAGTAVAANKKPVKKNGGKSAKK